MQNQNFGLLQINQEQINQLNQLNQLGQLGLINNYQNILQCSAFRPFNKNSVNSGQLEFNGSTGESENDVNN